MCVCARAGRQIEEPDCLISIPQFSKSFEALQLCVINHNIYIFPLFSPHRREIIRVRKTGYIIYV